MILVRKKKNYKTTVPISVRLKTDFFSLRAFSKEVAGTSEWMAGEDQKEQREYWPQKNSPLFRAKNGLR